MTERRSIEFSDIAATKLLGLERKHKAAPVGILLAGEKNVVIDRHGRVTWLDRPTEACRWIEDEDGVWFADCGAAWEFGDGGPLDNDCHYCHKCGRRCAPVPLGDT